MRGDVEKVERGRSCLYIIGGRRASEEEWCGQNSINLNLNLI